jgi:hypothetical protein
VSNRQRRRQQKHRRHREPSRPHPSLPGKRQLAAAGGIALAAGLATGPPSAEAATFTVVNTNNAGAGSLRDALLQANASQDADTIVFASGLTGTIHLGSTLNIYYATDIQGPGADKITVSGGNSVRDFNAGCIFCPTFPITISGLTIADGRAVQGGGIAQLIANLTVSDCVITGNTAFGTTSVNGSGGGIYDPNGSLTVKDSIVTGNTAEQNAPYGGYGGGIFVSGNALSIQDSTLSGNHADNAGGAVEIVYNGPTLIEDTTVSGNSASGSSPTNGNGGGIEVIGQHADVSINNSTLFGNQARYGGGLFASQPEGHQLTVRGSTIAGNSATISGGGGFRPPAATAPQLLDTIIGQNSGPTAPDLSGTFDGAFSLIQNPAGAAINETVPGSNITGADPQLGPLANNGGPTATMALTATSPAVDKGSSFGLAADQRGVLRPIDFPAIADSGATGADGADIGAFELQPSNAFKLGKLRKNKQKGTAKLTVKLPLPDAGKLTLFGKGLKRKRKAVKGKKAVKLLVATKGKARKRLLLEGTRKVKIKVKYAPTGNSPKTKKRRAKLIKRR